MSVVQTNTGLFAVSGLVRASLAGDGRNNTGEVLSWANEQTIKSANLAGWYEGTGTITRAGAQVNYNIDFGSTNPLGTLGTGTFSPGFVANNKYLFYVYYELLTNTANPTVTMEVFFAPGGTILGFMSTPGDCWLNTVTNVTAASLAGVPAHYVFLDGNATVTFKLVALYRSTATPA